MCSSESQGEPRDGQVTDGYGSRAGASEPVGVSTNRVEVHPNSGRTTGNGRGCQSALAFLRHRRVQSYAPVLHTGQPHSNNGGSHEYRNNSLKCTALGHCDHWLRNSWSTTGAHIDYTPISCGIFFLARRCSYAQTQLPSTIGCGLTIHSRRHAYRNWL